jgi:hypothetical protein
VKPVLANAGQIEQFPGQEELFFSLDITFQVMAVTEMSPGHQDAVGPLSQGPYDEHRVYAARAHHPYRPHVGRVLQPGHPCQIRSGIGAPVAQKRYDFWFEFCHTFTFHL